MLNSISKKDRLERTLRGIEHQIDDFFFIIENYVKTLSEEEMKGLYELYEDELYEDIEPGKTEQN